MTAKVVQRAVSVARSDKDKGLKKVSKISVVSQKHLDQKKQVSDLVQEMREHLEGQQATLIAKGNNEIEAAGGTGGYSSEINNISSGVIYKDATKTLKGKDPERAGRMTLAEYDTVSQERALSKDKVIVQNQAENASSYHFNIASEYGTHELVKQ